MYLILLVTVLWSSWVSFYYREWYIFYSYCFIIYFFEFIFIGYGFGIRYVLDSGDRGEGGRWGFFFSVIYFLLG